MQQSRLYSVLVALFAFSLFAFASPVASKEVVARTDDPLTVVLNLCLDLQVKIKAILVLIGTLPSFPSLRALTPVSAKLSATADISVLVGQIVVLVNACVTALISVGAIVDLSDTVKINAIATVCAQIIVDIHACITVFVAILVNVVACANLDLALQALLVQLNICISGILLIIAPL